LPAATEPRSALTWFHWLGYRSPAAPWPGAVSAKPFWSTALVPLR